MLFRQNRVTDSRRAGDQTMADSYRVMTSP
jgi:hypothetical protein